MKHTLRSVTCWYCAPSVELRPYVIISIDMGQKTKVNKSRSSDIALRVERVSKSFHLPTEQASGIKQAFINRMRGIKGYKKQQVLKDISFEVEKGDFFGIVGRNGSGKSTLLKLISQIYHPDSGKITVNGSLVPFIELGVGFNPELTGRENVYLNGAMLGFSRDEIDDMYDDIVEFAELADFMDQKLKNYSSGMQVRLAFSVAIKAQGDILVLDEVLAVGDEAFQRKCFSYFAELKRHNKTVVLVTHSMDSVQRFCNKAILIDKGHHFIQGSSAEVASMYRELNADEDSVAQATIDEEDEGTNSSEYVDISCSSSFKDANLVSIDLKVIPRQRLEDVAVTLCIIRDTGEEVFRWVTDEKIEGRVDMVPDKDYKINLEIQNIFPDGSFFIQAGVKKRDRSKSYILVEKADKFTVITRGTHEYDVVWKPHTSFQTNLFKED